MEAPLVNYPAEYGFFGDEGRLCLFAVAFKEKMPVTGTG